jgi:hypothetical protein
VPVEDDEGRLDSSPTAPSAIARAWLSRSAKRGQEIMIRNPLTVTPEHPRWRTGLTQSRLSSRSRNDRLVGCQAYISALSAEIIESN